VTDDVKDTFHDKQHKIHEQVLKTHEKEDKKTAAAREEDEGDHGHDGQGRELPIIFGKRWHMTKFHN
jgi:hypothetical protein